MTKHVITPTEAYFKCSCGIVYREEAKAEQHVTSEAEREQSREGS